MVPPIVNHSLGGGLTDGNSREVPVDVHHPYSGWTSNEDEVEPNQPDSDSYDGTTLWYLREDGSDAEGTGDRPFKVT